MVTWTEFGNQGSVHRKDRDNIAYMGVIDGKPKVNWNWNDNANPKYGAASRGV